jgi:hypothetical protein
LVFELFERFRALVEGFGPAKVIAQKSRVVFQVRMRFAALMPQKRALRGHLILSERHPANCFAKIETFSPRNHLHAFRLERQTQLDDQFRFYVGLAYRVGQQEHLD